MAMTTPVLTRATADGGAGDMSFVLPSRYWDAVEAPPSPLDGGVTISRRGGGALEASAELACLWFGGFAGAGEVAQRKEELKAKGKADAAAVLEANKARAQKGKDAAANLKAAKAAKKEEGKAAARAKQEADIAKQAEKKAAKAAKKAAAKK